jgi:hypothetical protein
MWPPRQLCVAAHIRWCCTVECGSQSVLCMSKLEQFLQPVDQATGLAALMSLQGDFAGVEFYIGAADMQS